MGVFPVGVTPCSAFLIISCMSLYDIGGAAVFALLLLVPVLLLVDVVATTLGGPVLLLWVVSTM